MLEQLQKERFDEQRLQLTAVMEALEAERRQCACYNASIRRRAAF